MATWPESPLTATSGSSVSCDHVFAFTQTRSFEFAQQRLGVLQVGGVETLGEPAVGRRQEIAGLVGPALVASQTCEAGGGAFVVTVESFGDFAAAICEKLIREITGSVVAAKPGLERL